MFVEDLQSHQPDYHKSQDESLKWLAKAWAQKQGRDYESTHKLFTRVGCRKAQIAQRYYYLDEFNENSSWEILAEKENQGHFKKSQFFTQVTERIFKDLYQDVSAPSHLIHVTCTGYASPSSAQKFVSKNFSGTPEVYHAYHMGCYASIPSLRMAKGVLASAPQSHTVDIVHTELCSLHLNPFENSLEQMVIQSLFADGAIRYRLSDRKPEKGFQVMALRERIIPGTEEAMTWITADHGMHMSLSKEIPALISKHLKNFFEQWNQDLGNLIDFSKCIFAIHPGGPKIIDFAKDALTLNESQISFSRDVLYWRGNMSSATLPHIWEKIFHDTQVPAGTNILSVAFGPGITMAASWMRKL